MGQSAEQLKREIEYMRGDLSETLDAIGDRVSPGRLMERRKNRFINGLQGVRDRVMGTASDAGSAVGDAAGGAVDTLKQTSDTVRQQAEGNPLAAGAVAVGVGVLLASIFPASEKERRAADQLMDKAEPLKDELMETGREMAEHLKEPAREAVQQVKDTATEGTQSVTDTAKEAVGTTSETASEGAQQIRNEAAGDV
jgi:ElaB/YqjD/DUF883 family membrane-anchored ribosome-binding protein